MNKVKQEKQKLVTKLQEALRAYDYDFLGEDLNVTDYSLVNAYMDYIEARLDDLKNEIGE